MGNILDDLINKQQLVADYLVQNYVIGRDPITSDKRILDKYSTKVVYGKDIEEDILLFYPFGEKVMRTVLDVWLETFGLRRNSTEFRLIWNKPRLSPDRAAELGDVRIDERFINQNIDDGPLRIQTYLDLPYGEFNYDHRGFGGSRTSEAELQYVRGIAQNIIVELADDRGISRILHDCRSIRGLNDAMQRIGFESFEARTASGTRIHWAESEERWRNRRERHYRRLRNEREMDIAMDRVNAQRDLIERHHMERQARLQHEYERQRQEDEYRIQRARYEQERDNNNGGYYIL